MLLILNIFSRKTNHIKLGNAGEKLRRDREERQRAWVSGQLGSSDIVWANRPSSLTVIISIFNVFTRRKYFEF